MYKLRMVEKKTITEDETRPDRYRITCYDFLRLTSDPNMLKSINRDIENPKYAGWGGEPFSREKMGRAYLLINKQNKVDGHEGRHRAAMLLKQEGTGAEMEIDIAMRGDEDVSLQDGDVIYGQHDPKQTVTVGGGTLEYIDPSEDNILNIGAYGTTWKGQDAYDRFQIFMSDKSDATGLSPKKLVNLVNQTYRITDDYDDYRVGYDYEFILTNSSGEEPVDFISMRIKRQ